MYKNSKGVVHLLILIPILLFIFIIGLFYYIGQLQLPPLDPSEVRYLLENQNSPTPIETVNTTDWKTYRNEEYGYEFKYPSDILIPVKCKDGVNFYDPTSKAPWSTFCNSHLITMVYAIKEFSQEQIDSSNFKVTTKTMVVDGHKATKQIVKKTNENIEGSDFVIYVTFKNDKYFLFTLKQQNLEDEFSQILSTFQFLDNQEDESDYSFECPDSKILDCTPCTTGPCPLFHPQYCSKGSAQYNWIIENCPYVEIVGLD